MIENTCCGGSETENITVLHNTGMSLECVFHLTVQEHCVLNTDLSNGYFELPNQHSNPFPPKLLGSFDSLSLL